MSETFFMNIAHRGFSARYPENTILAFQKALDLGVKWMEFDLQITQDGHIVIIHDKTVDRTTDGTGEVSSLSLAQIQSLDAGIHAGEEFAGQQIPTFNELLDFLAGKSRMAVELKFEDDAFIPKVIEALKDRDLIDQVSISSFDLPKLPKVKSICPEVSTTALLKRHEGRIEDGGVSETLAMKADTFGPHFSEATQEMVNAAHDAGLAVRCWGLGKDQGPELERIIDLNAEGLTTDHPDILQDILKRRNML